MLVRIPPKYSVSEIVGYLKGKQRKTIRYFTEDLKEVGHEDSLWQFQNGEKVEKQ